MDSNWNAFNADRDIDKLLSPTAATVLRLFLILYVSHIVPALPDHVLKWFAKPWFKIIFLALLVWFGTHDPFTSLLIAAAFVVTMNTISGRQPFDSFRDLHQ